MTALTAIGFTNGNFESWGTCLQGYISTNYDTLVGCFGEPVAAFDDFKSDCEWNIRFADGVIATIYNYKDGKNYCGEDGLELNEITCWHIGGHNGTGVQKRVAECLDAYLTRVCING